MLITTKLYDKIFVGEDSKETYLLVCKWVAQRLMKVEVNGISYNIEKLKDKDLPTFQLTIYLSLDEKAVFRDSRCRACKEFHRSFYINQDLDCRFCKLTGFLKEAKSVLDNKVKYDKERVNLD